MPKILYSESTSQLSPYPRNDDNQIIGLDSDYLMLTQIESLPPNYDIETQTIVDDWEVDLEALEYRQVWTVINLPVIDNPPNWDGFNLAFSTLPSLLQAELIANQNHPSIVGKKDLAYSMISDHGVATFGLIFPLFCQAGGVDNDTRTEWALMAQSFNMPTDFISVIRG